jgi:hypothetical protein
MATMTSNLLTLVQCDARRAWLRNRLATDFHPDNCPNLRDFGMEYRDDYERAVRDWHEAQETTRAELEAVSTQRMTLYRLGMRA